MYSDLSPGFKNRTFSMEINLLNNSNLPLHRLSRHNEKYFTTCRNILQGFYKFIFSIIFHFIYTDLLEQIHGNCNPSFVFIQQLVIRLHQFYKLAAVAS